jgi:hypothetical protein
MNELDRLATTGKMIDQARAPQGMPMAPQGMPMAPQGMTPQGMAPQAMPMAPGMKKGGKVSKADMQKAGFYDKGKTKSERQKIVKKVTTKPQRVAIVEKAFSTKKMKAGGAVSSASKRADGCAIKGKTRA